MDLFHHVFSHIGKTGSRMTVRETSTLPAGENKCPRPGSGPITILKGYLVKGEGLKTVNRDT